MEVEINMYFNRLRCVFREKIRLIYNFIYYLLCVYKKCFIFVHPMSRYLVSNSFPNPVLHRVLYATSFLSLHFLTKEIN